MQGGLSSLPFVAIAVSLVSLTRNTLAPAPVFGRLESPPYTYPSRDLE